MKTLKRLLFFTAGICLLIACSKSDQFLGDDSFGNNLKNSQNGSVIDFKYTPGTSYELTGLALYKTWTVKEGTVIQDNKLECIGTLEFLEGRNFIYTFQELRENGNAAQFYGKISASGTLTFQFPSPLFVDPVKGPFYITDVIKSHTCISKIWGPGVNKGTLYFNGKFDGNRFTAEAKFMALVDESCPDLFNPVYNGQVHWIFGYDLTVVE
jgi:hypothetical protein